MPGNAKHSKRVNKNYSTPTAEPSNSVDDLPSQQKQISFFNDDFLARQTQQENSEKTVNDAKPQKVESVEKVEKIEKPTKPIKSEKTAKVEKPTKSIKPENTAKVEKPTKPIKPEKTAKVEKPTKPIKPEKTVKVEKPTKPIKPENTAKVEKPTKPIKPENTAKVEKPTKSMKPEKTAKVEKPAKPIKPERVVKNESAEKAFKVTKDKTASIYNELLAYIGNIYMERFAKRGFGGGIDNILQNITDYTASKIMKVAKTNGRQSEAERLCMAIFKTAERFVGLPLAIKITVALDMHDGGGNAAKLATLFDKLYESTELITGITTAQAKEAIGELVAFAKAQGIKV